MAEIEKFKEITNMVRKVLLLLASRENPFDFTTNYVLEKELRKDKYFTADFIKYMYDARLFQGANTSCPSLTPIGLQLAQDIFDNDLWDKATEFCDERGLYSLESVVNAAGVIRKKMIDEELA